MKRFLSAALICFVSAFSAAQAANPIHVTACNPKPPSAAVPGFVPGYYPARPYYWPDVYGYRYLQPPLVNNPSLSIDYVNVGHATANAVEFGLLARGNLVAEVRDAGTFSPGAEIKHEFGLNPNVFPLGTGLPICVALRVHFADGTKWVNPRLPALRRSLYR